MNGFIRISSIVICFLVFTFAGTPAHANYPNFLIIISGEPKIKRNAALQSQIVLRIRERLIVLVRNYKPWERGDELNKFEKFLNSPDCDFAKIRALHKRWP